MSTILHTFKFIRRSKIGDWRLSSPVQRTYNDILLHTNCRIRSLCTATTNNNSQRRRDFSRPLALKDTKDGNVHEQLTKIGEKIKYSGHVLKSDIDEIMNSVVKAGTLTHMQSLLLLRACTFFTFYESENTRKSLCDTVWNTIKAYDVKLDVNCYNALLLTYLENHLDFSPIEILSEMKTKNIEPNSITYQRFIDKYCKKGDIASTTKMLEQMNKENVPISEAVFNSLIQGHSISGNDSNALNVLNIMANAGIYPSSITYTHILCMHAKNGNIEAIRTTFAECKEKKIGFMDKDILEIIYTLAINGHLQYLEELTSHFSKNLSYNKIANKYIQLLIEKHQVDAALTLYKTLLPDKVYFKKYVSLFTRKMVISDLNIDDLIKYCSILKKENIDVRVFENAVYYAYTNDLSQLAVPLLIAYNDIGGDIREHYFFPCMVSNIKKNNLQDTLDLLKTMSYNFNIKPSIKTLMNFVIPYIMESPEKIITILESCNVTYSKASNAIFFHMLQQNKLEKASEFLTKTFSGFNTRMLIDNITIALNTTNDIKSFMKIIDHHYNILKNDFEKFGEDLPREINAEAFLKHQINDVLNKISKNRALSVVKELLGYMSKHCLKLNNDTVKRIIDHFNGQLDQSTTFFLNKLKTNNSDLDVPVENSDSDISKQIVLIKNCILDKDVEIVKNMIKELEKKHTDIPPNFCEYLGNYFVKVGFLTEAEKWIMKAVDYDSLYKPDSETIIRFANAKLKEKKIDETLKILSYPCEKKSKHMGNECINLFDTLCFHYPNKVLEAFQIFLNYKGLPMVNENLASFLIKKFISTNRKDYSLQIFKYMCDNYKIVLQKFTLYKYFIEHEDTESLQQVTDVSVNMIGEKKALFELGTAFCECNRIQQAKKIFMVDGIITRVQVDMIVDIYLKKKEVDNLEHLCLALIGVYDRIDDIFVKLIKLYESVEQPERCHELWTKLQDDSSATSFLLLHKLEQKLNLYSRSNIENSDENSEENKNRLLYKLDAIARSLKSNETKEAVKIVNEILENVDNLRQRGKFLELATNIVSQLLLIDDLQSSVQLISNLRKTFTRYLDGTKTLNEFYFEKNKYNEFLINVEELYKNKIDFQLNDAIHTYTTVKAMLQDPKIEETIQNIVSKNDIKDVQSLLNAMWLTKFIQDSPDADIVWNTYLKDTPFQAFTAILSLNNLNMSDKFPELCEKIMDNSAFNVEFKNNILSQMCTSLLKTTNPNKYELIYNCLHHGVKVIEYSALNEKILDSLSSNLKNGLTIESLRDKSKRLKQMAV